MKHTLVAEVPQHHLEPTPGVGQLEMDETDLAALLSVLLPQVMN